MQNCKAYFTRALNTAGVDTDTPTAFEKQAIEPQHFFGSTKGILRILSFKKYNAY